MSKAKDTDIPLDYLRAFDAMGDVKQRISAFLAGGVLALALFGSAMAGPLEDGEAAYRIGDYATAMRLLRPLAQQGNADAQITLGKMYNFGFGVPKDYAQAVASGTQGRRTRERRRAGRPRRDIR